MTSQGLPTGFPQYEHDQYQPPSGPPPSYQVQTTYSYNQSGHGLSPPLPPRPGQTTGYTSFPHHGSYPANYNQRADDGRPASVAPPMVDDKAHLQVSTNPVSNDTQGPAEATSPQNRNDQAIIAQAMRFVQIAAPPPNTAASPLVKPVAIPHLTQSNFVTYTQPVGTTANMYARVYSPALEPHGVSEVEFLTFLDGLNLVSTSSQALQAVNVANAVLSFDPTGLVQSVTIAAQVGLQAGQQKVFNHRAAAFLRRANAEFFHPRRLHVQQRTLDELRGIAHIPDDAPLTMPITVDSVRASIAENRVRALQPWLAPLKFDVPAAAAPPANNTLQKINNFQSKHLNKQLERDSIASRLKELSKNPQALSADDVKGIAANVRASGDRILTWQANRFEKKMLKAIGSEKPGAEKNTGKEREEEKATRRSKWLVVITWDGQEGLL